MWGTFRIARIRTARRVRSLLFSIDLVGNKPRLFWGSDWFRPQQRKRNRRKPLQDDAAKDPGKQDEDRGEEEDRPEARGGEKLAVHKGPNSAADEQIEGDKGHDGAASFGHKLLRRRYKGRVDQDERESKPRKRQREPDGGVPGRHERPRRGSQDARVDEEPASQLLSQRPGLPTARDCCQAEESEDQANKKDVVSGPCLDEIAAITKASEYRGPKQEDDADGLDQIGISKCFPVGVPEAQAGNCSRQLLKDFQHDESSYELGNSIDQIDQPPGTEKRHCPSNGCSRRPPKEHNAQDFSQGGVSLVGVSAETVPYKRVGHGNNGGG